MKVHEAIKWLSALPAGEDIIINWWGYDDLIVSGGSEELTPNEWKHLADKINRKGDWECIQNHAIEESYDIVAQREDLFKDKSG